MEWLTARDLAALAWCPTLLYLRRRGPGIGFRPRHYDPVERREHDSLVEETLRSLERENPGCRALPHPVLESPALGVRGSPDILVVCPDRCIVVEVKTRRSTHGLDKLQLSIYAELAADGPCRDRRVEALLVAGGSAEEVRPRRLEIAGLARRARSILSKGAPPAPAGRPRGACRPCLYRHVCPYAEGKE